MVNVEVKSKLKFHKSLAKYYYKWLKDSYQSYKHCEDNGKMESARQYWDNCQAYVDLIRANYEAIEFFSIGDNAFIKDSALPPRFRRYE